MRRRESFAGPWCHVMAGRFSCDDGSAKIGAARTALIRTAQKKQIVEELRNFQTHASSPTLQAECAIKFHVRQVLVLLSITFA